MNLLFDILCMVLVSSTFIIEYAKTKRVYSLLGVPIIFYLFVIIPILGRLNINKTFTLIITMVMVIISLIYAYKGWQIEKKLH